MHSISDKFTEREGGLPDRLRAIAADEIEGRRPVLSPANSHDLLTAADEIERLRTAIRRLADQDATLSVCDGNVTVTMDGPLVLPEGSKPLAWIGVFDGEPDPEFLWPDESAARRWINTRPGVELAPLVLGAFDRPQPIAKPKQDTTPAQGSVPPECATAPGWMARPFWVDPPSGWQYGFPRLYDPAKDGDMTEWLVANGYPQHLADQHLPCTFTACTDSQ